MDRSRYHAVMYSPVGRLGIWVVSNCLKGIDFLDDSVPLQMPENKVAQRAVEQLQAYFEDSDTEFDLCCDMEGSDFRMRVWERMQAIPAGETLSYGEMAKQLNSSPRAVGGACRNNPIPIVVPCHRVVSQNGIGGYGGDWGTGKVSVKRWLLQHEGLQTP